MTAHGFDGGCRGLCITNEKLRAVPPVNMTGLYDSAANDSLQYDRAEAQNGYCN
jgi:hypothetical protein